MGLTLPLEAVEVLFRDRKGPLLLHVVLVELLNLAREEHRFYRCEKEWTYHW